MRHPWIVAMLVTLFSGALVVPAQAQTVRAISLTLSRQVVKPGQTQVVTVRSTPGALLLLTTTFPNYATIEGRLQLSSTGRGRWSFKQPKSTVTPEIQIAVVTATYEDGSGA